MTTILAPASTPLPTMHPILFKVPFFDFPITTFGLMVVLGFIAASHVFVKINLRYTSDPREWHPRLDAVPIDRKSVV